MNGRPTPPLAGSAAAVTLPPASRLGVWLLIAYLFFLQSRVLDFTVPQLHLPLVLFFGLCVFALLSGNFFSGLMLPVGRLAMLFVFLLGLATLFSLNRRQSASIVVSDMRHLTMCFAMIAMLVSIQNIRRSLQAIAWGTLVAAILGFIFEVTVEGQRLGLAVGRFGDPNDYAMVLVMGFPLWLTVGTGVLRAVLGLPAAAVILFSFAKAGSRGGLLAFAALTIAYFLTTTSIGKLRTAVLVVVMGVAAVMIVPAGIRQRYVTIFSADEQSFESNMEAQRSYIESSNSRRALLLASIAATFRHPIFGVGPGSFPEYYWQQGFVEEKRNRQGMHTHNTYTQVSSEAGIPAVLCMVSILFLCFRMAWRASRESQLAPDHPIRVCGRALWLSMISWATAALFLSTAWTEVIFIYIAFSGSLAYVHRREIASIPKQGGASEKPAAGRAKTGLPRLLPTGRPVLRPIS